MGFPGLRLGIPSRRSRGEAIPLWFPVSSTALLTSPGSGPLFHSRSQQPNTYSTLPLSSEHLRLVRAQEKMNVLLPRSLTSLQMLSLFCCLSNHVQVPGIRTRASWAGALHSLPHYPKISIIHFSLISDKNITNHTFFISPYWRDAKITWKNVLCPK